MAKIFPKLVAFTVFMLLLACHAKKPLSQTPADDKAADTIRTTHSNNIDDSLLDVGDIDTAQYNNLPYWDSTIDHAYAQGYNDTFSVGGTQFRLIHNDSTFDGTLERLVNGHWIVQWIAENLGNHNEYTREVDLNGDGYNDFIFYFKWFGEVYFFNPATKAFSAKRDCTIGVGWEEIDSVRHIYHEELTGKLRKPVESNLFTFRGNQRIELLTLTLNFNPDDNDYIITGGNLADTAGHVITKNVKPAEKTGVLDFDYKAFWLGNLKNIPGFK